MMIKYERSKYLQKKKTKSLYLVFILVSLLVTISCGCISDDGENGPKIIISNFDSPCRISEDLFDFELQPSETSNPLTFSYNIVAKEEIREFKFRVCTLGKASLWVESKEVIFPGIRKENKRSDKIEIPISTLPSEIYEIYIHIEATPFEGEKIIEDIWCSLIIEGNITDYYKLDEWKKHERTDSPIEILENSKCIGKFELDWWIDNTKINENEELSVVCMAKTLFYDWEKRYIILYIAVFDDQGFITNKPIDSTGFALGSWSGNVRIVKFSTKGLKAGERYFVCINYSYEENSLKYSKKAQIIGEPTEIRVFSE